MLYHTNSLHLCQTARIQKAGKTMVSTENAQDERPSSTSLPKQSNLYLISSLLLPAICLLCKKRCSPSWAASCKLQEHSIKSPKVKPPSFTSATVSFTVTYPTLGKQIPPTDAQKCHQVPPRRKYYLHLQHKQMNKKPKPHTRPTQEWLGDFKIQPAFSSNS